MTLFKFQKKVKLPIAVNWHLEPRCNYRCKFCFAHFIDVKKESDYDPALLISDLWERGVKKLTFVGGEPMLDRRVDTLIPLAKRIGLTTCIVTNGTRVKRRWLESMVGHLDWIGFSIDASSDVTHAKMGRGNAWELSRGKSNHLTRCLESWEIARDLGFGLKLNTVVTSHNVDDDMSALVTSLSPHRWKVFQVLRVEGENDDTWDDLVVPDKAFTSWVDRHSHLEPVVESNDLMRGSYCMIDGQLRFKTDAGGKLFYGRSIADVGIDEAWRDIVNWGFDNKTFLDRGGEWEWTGR